MENEEGEELVVGVFDAEVWIVGVHAVDELGPICLGCQSLHLVWHSLYAYKPQGQK